MSYQSTFARFWSKVDTTGDCWLWTAATSTAGYGRFYLAGRLVQAHRYAYELLAGPIPEGLMLDHLCRTRACVRPEHLEPVTNQENARRGAKGSLVTVCAQGHDYTPENTRLKRSGQRTCRACDRAYRRAASARRRAAA